MSTTLLCETKGWICIFCNTVHLVLSPSLKKDSILRKVFRALSTIFSSESIQPPSALPALRLVAGLDLPASYELFKKIMASNDLTDQHWEAARLIARCVTQSGSGTSTSKEILKFLDHHLGLHGTGEDHSSAITSTFRMIIRVVRYFGVRSVKLPAVDPLTVKCIRNFNCASNPSFVRGIRLIMRPDDPLDLQPEAIRLVSLTPDQWFYSPVPVMEPEEMSEFCEHLAVFMVDSGPRGPDSQKDSVTVLFGMLRSSEWRKHIVTRLWRVLADCRLVEEEQESFRWCLRNAIELLEFTRQLPNGEGWKWWNVTLWLHYGKLSTAVRDEIRRVLMDTPPRDGSLERDVHRDVMREVTRIQNGLSRRRSESDTSESDTSESDVIPVGRPWYNDYGYTDARASRSDSYSFPPLSSSCL